MQNVYFISGLGADKRAFQFLDLTFCNPVFVDWITPLKGESIKEYATRLKAQIPDEEPIIVGLSFGGMIAIEIAKCFPVKKLILLSSAKNEKEIPFYLRYMRYVPLHKIMSPSLLRSTNRFAYRLMGTDNRRDKIIFKQMIRDADDRFISWAINQIIHWKNKDTFTNLVHIHGTADILLPYKYVKADHPVEAGEHLMILVNADVISKLLQSVISDQLSTNKI